MRAAVVAEEAVKNPPKKLEGMLLDWPSNASPEILASVQAAMNKAVKLLGDKLILDADRLAQVIVGLATPSSELVQERVERRKTINTLTATTEWLTAVGIQSSAQGHPRTVADWKRRARIFGVTGPEGKDLYPAYQFDAAMRPLPVIASILHAFGPVTDPWMLVAWFHFPNGWLVRQDDPARRPQAPKDFLDDETAVVRAANLHSNSYVA